MQNLQWFKDVVLFYKHVMQTAVTESLYIFLGEYTHLNVCDVKASTLKGKLSWSQQSQTVSNA